MKRFTLAQLMVLLLVAAAAAAGLASLRTTPERVWSASICFICRCEADRTRDRVDERPTEFTAWYRARRPGHVHAWHHIRMCREAGDVVEVWHCSGEFIPHNPIWLIPPAEQRAFLELCSPAEWDAFEEMLRAHDQMGAANVVLAARTPPHILCAGLRKTFTRQCERVIPRAGAVVDDTGARRQTYCSEACRSNGPGR